jgi:hypothetical protein
MNIAREMNQIISFRDMNTLKTPSIDSQRRVKIELTQLSTHQHPYVT